MGNLGYLIGNDYCPLSIGSLNKWRKYEKGTGRVYPVDDLAFNNWIKLDFDDDGKPDYSSPYQLRLELVSRKMDFTERENRYKLGSKSQLLHGLSSIETDANCIIVCP